MAMYSKSINMNMKKILERIMKFLFLDKQEEFRKWYEKSGSNDDNCSVQDAFDYWEKNIWQ